MYISAIGYLYHRKIERAIVNEKGATCHESIHKKMFCAFFATFFNDNAAWI